jgi:hypothetical protein
LADKTADFPVNSLLFRPKLPETGSQKTASPIDAFSAGKGGRHPAVPFDWQAIALANAERPSEETPAAATTDFSRT